MDSDVTIDDLIRSGALYLTDGYRTRRDQLDPQGPPIMRVGHVRDGFIDVDGTDHISEEFRSKFEQKTSQLGDTVVTTKGTVGRAALVGVAHAGYVYSPQTCVLRSLDPSMLDPGWIYYWVRSPEAQGQFAVYSGQTDMAPYIKLKDFRSFRISVPPHQEQVAIAEVLGSLDDRANWCRRTAHRLLAGLQAVGRGGDRRVPVAELATYVNGGAFTKHANDDGRLIIRITELKSGVSESSKYTTYQVRADRIADPGDILFSWSATLDVFRWTGEQALINQHIFKVIPDGYPAWLVYAKLAEAMREFQKIAADRATTMGHIKKAHLKQVTVPVLSGDELARRDATGTALWEKHLLLEQEARTLERTRGALLPELVTGRLRIADVDGFLDRAGLAA